MATIPDGVKAATPKPPIPRNPTKPPAKELASGDGQGSPKSLKDIKFRLGFVSVAFIILVALGVDFSQWLMTLIIIGELGLNILLGGIMGWIGFPLIYAFVPQEPITIYGFKKDEMARFITSAVASLIETIPLFDNIPAITLGQIIIILTVYAQDILNSGLLNKEFARQLGPAGRLALKLGSKFSGEKDRYNEAMG